MPAINPPTGGNVATQPAYVPGKYGLTAGIQNLSVPASQAKAASNTPLGSPSSALELLNVSFAPTIANGRVFCFDLFVGGAKKVTDLPVQSGNSNGPGGRALHLHIPASSALAFNANSNAAGSFNMAAFGYTADVAEPCTVIEPIGPVGANPAFTGTLVKVLNGATSSGWVCINPGASGIANAYKRLYPFVSANGDYTGRTITAGVIEYGYADDQAGTVNFVNIGAEQVVNQTTIFFYSLDLNNIPCSIPAGKYLFARITQAVASNKTTGTTTDGDPYNVQLHGGR